MSWYQALHCKRRNFCTASEAVYLRHYSNESAPQLLLYRSHHRIVVTSLLSNLFSYNSRNERFHILHAVTTD